MDVGRGVVLKSRAYEYFISSFQRYNLAIGYNERPQIQGVLRSQYSLRSHVTFGSHSPILQKQRMIPWETSQA